MPFSPFTTKVHDYLANDSFAVSPFDTPVLPRAYLRLHPLAPPSAPSAENAGETVLDRRAALARAIAEGRAELGLEIATRPYGPWRPLARVRLVEVLEGDPVIRAGGVRPSLRRAPRPRIRYHSDRYACPRGRRR